MLNDDVMAPVYSGQGILQLKTKSTNQVVAQNLGTIDYDTGSLDITSMTVTDVSGAGNDDILVVVSPHESAKNISTDLLVRSTAEQNYAVDVA